MGIKNRSQADINEKKTVRSLSRRSSSPSKKKNSISAPAPSTLPCLLPQLGPRHWWPLSPEFSPTASRLSSPSCWKRSGLARPNLQLCTCGHMQSEEVWRATAQHPSTKASSHLENVQSLHERVREVPGRADWHPQMRVEAAQDINPHERTVHADLGVRVQLQAGREPDRREDPVRSEEV